MVTFVIPFKSHSCVRAARVSLKLLNATLNSIIRQSDPRWRIVLVADDPLQATLPSDKLEIIKLSRESTTDLLTASADAASRRRHGARHAISSGTDFVMTLDADDLIHRDLVSTVHRGNSKTCYLIVDGFQYYYRFDRMYLLRGTFHAKSGSCAVIPSGVLIDQFNILGQIRIQDWYHHAFLERIANCSIERVKFPAAVYCVGHGGNITRSIGPLRGKFPAISEVAFAARTLVKCILGRRLNERDRINFGGFHVSGGVIEWSAARNQVPT